MHLISIAVIGVVERTMDGYQYTQVSSDLYCGPRICGRLGGAPGRPGYFARGP